MGSTLFTQVKIGSHLHLHFQFSVPFYAAPGPTHDGHQWCTVDHTYNGSLERRCEPILKRPFRHIIAAAVLRARCPPFYSQNKFSREGQARGTNSSQHREQKTMGGEVRELLKLLPVWVLNRQKPQRKDFILLFHKKTHSQPPAIYCLPFAPTEPLLSPVYPLAPNRALAIVTDNGRVKKKNYYPGHLTPEIRKLFISSVWQVCEISGNSSIGSNYFSLNLNFTNWPKTCV